MESITAEEAIVQSSSAPMRSIAFSIDLVESREYKAALALNNVGVALLEKNLHRDALDILKASFSLIKNLKVLCELKTAVDPTNLMLERLAALSQIDARLHKGQQLLASCRDRNGNGERHFDVQLLSDYNNDEIRDAAHTYPMSDSGYAMRIDTSCDYLTYHVVLQSSIIMMNLGTACRCVAASIPPKKTPTQKCKYIRHCNRVFHIAYTILCSRRSGHHSLSGHNMMSDIDCDDDDIMLERSELVIMLLVQGLMQTSFELELRDEGLRYYTLLGDLHVGRAKRESVSPICLGQIAPAA